MNEVCRAEWKSDRANHRRSKPNDLAMRNTRQTIVKGLLLFSVLSVYVYASGATVPSYQTANQDSELAQASELSNAGVKLYNAGNYKHALDPAKQALEIRERLLSPNDVRLITSVGNLAAIHLALKNYKEAEGFYRRLLAADEKRFGPETLQVANTLGVLAWLYHARGNESEAEANYKRVLAIKEKTTGAESKEVAQTLFRLAEMYQSRGEFEKAVPLYQRLLTFDDEVLLGGNITVEDSRHSFACLLRKMKKPDEAANVERGFKYNDINQPPGDIARSISATPEMKGGVLNGKAISLPKPEYPPKARFAGVSGTVVVQVTISEEGRVIRACAVSGDALLWEVTERAAYAAKFSPTKLSGKPVKVTGLINYNFVRR